MKLIIDFPDASYETVKNGTWCGSLYEELKNGTPLSESEDCVSRQAVLSHKEYTETEEGWSGYTVDADIIEQLPPVTPAEKVGQWIDTDNYYQRWKCSECGCHTRDARPNYCSNCGTKMQASPTGAESKGGTQHDD